MSFPNEPPTTLAEPPKRLGSVAIAIGVLAVMVVAGVIAGIAVLALRDDPSPDDADPPAPPASSAEVSEPAVPPSSSADADQTGPPVTEVQLPTSGDLTWPDSSWQAGDSIGREAAEPQSPCQTWTTDALPTHTAIHGRAFTLADGDGRAFAYVMSFQGETDASTAEEAILADGMDCAERLGGTGHPQQDLSSPIGVGAWIDVAWDGRVGSWGVARHGDRVVWLWIEAEGDASWLGQPDGPMADSLAGAVRRLAG